MKGVHCSWVDMMKIRQALSAGERGDQSRLEQIRCISKGAVSNWKTICNGIDAIEGKVQISELSNFQPSHMEEISRSFRREHGNPETWTDEVKEEIADWVDRCDSKEWTVRELRNELLRASAEPNDEPGCALSDLNILAKEGKKFGTIYADPPWTYSNQSTRGSTDRHYPTMSVEEIAALPVGDLAADDCHLHLWTTNNFVFEVPKILESWGFTYKSMFVWCKPQMGMGNYWRVSHELLFFAVKGNAPFRDRGLMSWGKIDRGKHSSKPEQVRAMIEKASPPPYLELFGREAVQGWAVWGNEVSKTLFCK